MDTTIDCLINDTLHGRRITGPGGSCLVTNEAGHELVSYEADIMENLESTIRVFEKTLVDQPEAMSKLVGIEYVLGAYLVNAARHDAMRGVDFIESCEAMLMQQLLANMPVFFRRMDVGYNFGVEPPAEYIELARKLKDSRIEYVATTATRVFERLTKRSR
jgi:hypothetical protein